MDDATKALISNLFGEATALIEDAHDLAVKGQSKKSNAKALIGVATALRAMTEEAGILAQAAMILARRAQQKGH